MVGRGPGWDNNNFLDSLGGDEDDRDDAANKYKEFQKFRNDFEKRQQERMSTEAGKKFLEAQKNARPTPSNFEEEFFGRNEMAPDDFDNIGTSGGGSRFRQMMQQSKRMSSMQNNPFGFEQKFVVPLEDIPGEDDDDQQSSS